MLYLIAYVLRCTFCITILELKCNGVINSTLIEHYKIYKIANFKFSE